MIKVAKILAKTAPAILLLLLVITRPAPLLAQDSIPNPSQWIGSVGRQLVGQNSQYGGGNVQVFPIGGLNYFTTKVVPFVIDLLLFIVTIASLVYLLIGGIMWMSSSGDKERLAKAKGTVTYALLGLALAFSSFIIIAVMQQFFSVCLGLPSAGCSLPPTRQFGTKGPY